MQCCSWFTSPIEQADLDEELSPNISAIYHSAHARFKSTMSIFMYFLKVRFGNAYTCPVIKLTSVPSLPMNTGA